MHLNRIFPLILLSEPALSFVILPDDQVFLESPSAPLLLQPDKVGSPRVGGLTSTRSNDDEADDDPLPVVIWHGLGDSADAAGLKDVAELINEVHEGTYVHIISLGASEGAPDRQQSFFGNLSLQIDQVCDRLAQDPILKTAPAIDAIGFSQGGQFLRGYIERCGHWAPPVRSLMTFGSQHNGIAEFQKCDSATDWVCQGANALLKSSTVWSDFVQSRLVPAQYYRNLHDYDSYLAHSNFLADINNEREVKNPQYAANLAALEQFVLLVFAQDQTVIPKESGWFAEVNVTKDEDGNSRTEITNLFDRPIFKQDWIGLKQLHRKGGLHFATLDGPHMKLKTEDLKDLFAKYFGPKVKKNPGRIKKERKKKKMASSPQHHRTWTREDGYVISTDVSLIPLASLNAAFGSPQLYWAKPLPTSDLRAMVDNSLYVYILPDRQGLGLGRWLIECVQEVVEAIPQLRRSMAITSSGSGSLVGWYERKMKMKAVNGAEAYKVMEWKGPGNVF
ncbi:hypothetical protein DV736_g6665, partial [Chaetothyriales sp. CBS 134916]